jgi:hypothetical protein
MSTGPEVIIHWYEETSYPEILAMMLDAENMPQRYEWWRRGMVEREEALARRGVVAKRITIDPETFASWSAETGYAPDAWGRIRFAAEMAERGDGQNLLPSRDGARLPGD